MEGDELYRMVARELGMEVDDAQEVSTEMLQQILELLLKGLP